MSNEDRTMKVIKWPERGSKKWWVVSEGKHGFIPLTGPFEGRFGEQRAKEAMALLAANGEEDE